MRQRVKFSIQHYSFVSSTCANLAKSDPKSRRAAGRAFSSSWWHQGGVIKMWCLAQKWLSSGVSASPTSIASYQTLPRQMPSHHAPIVPRYPDGYRTLPRNSLMRPESICSVSGSVYDRVLRPSSTSNFTAAEKRRSLRDDTMWQLYEWQQRQAFSRQSLAPPAGLLPPAPCPAFRLPHDSRRHSWV